MDKRCNEIVGGWGGSGCANKAKYGNKCGVHSPQSVAKRKARSAQYWKEQEEGWAKARDNRKEERRKLDAYDKNQATISRLREALKAQEAYEEGADRLPPISVRPSDWHTCRWCQDCVQRKDNMRGAALDALK